MKLQTNLSWLRFFMAHCVEMFTRRDKRYGYRHHRWQALSET